jgi:AcrR family transcriptional regulator
VAENDDRREPARRARRSREEASRALIAAAAALFAERSSGHVTVREIADRAGVNHGLVHRYFGTKQNLRRAALEKTQLEVAATLVDANDLRHSVQVVYRSMLGEKEFVAALARAALDGELPDFPAGYPTIQGLLERLEDAGAGRGSPPVDPRVVVLCLGSLVLGYDLFQEFLRRGTGLAATPDDEVEGLVLDVVLGMLELGLGPEQGRPSS